MDFVDNCDYEFFFKQGVHLKKLDCINRNVWETMKCIGSLLEDKEDNFENDMFYTPLTW